jgi:hypothetical protein
MNIVDNIISGIKEGKKLLQRYVGNDDKLNNYREWRTIEMEVINYDKLHRNLSWNISYNQWEYKLSK